MSEDEYQENKNNVWLCQGQYGVRGKANGSALCVRTELVLLRNSILCMTWKKWVY